MSGVYTGGVECPHVRLVAYCRTGQETHSRRILSCPPRLRSHHDGSGLQRQNRDLSSHMNSTYLHRGKTGRVRSGHFASLFSFAILYLLVVFSSLCDCNSVWSRRVLVVIFIFSLMLQVCFDPLSDSFESRSSVIFLSCCFKSLKSFIYDLGLHAVALLTVKTRNVNCPSKQHI